MTSDTPDEASRGTLLERFKALFSTCSPFFRDADLPDDIIDEHKVGLFLRERAFCDMSYKFGGFLGNHRYLVVSGNARNLEAFSQTPGWGLCLLPTNSLFKIIAVHAKAGRTQTTLLEMPDEFARYFSVDSLNQIETAFAEQAAEQFEAAFDTPPVPDLDSPEWLARLERPLGMNSKGVHFPLFENTDSMSRDQIVDAAIVLAYQARVHLANGDVAQAETILQQEKGLRARLG